MPVNTWVVACTVALPRLGQGLRAPPPYCVRACSTCATVRHAQAAPRSELLAEAIPEATKNMVLMLLNKVGCAPRPRSSGTSTVLRQGPYPRPRTTEASCAGAAKEKVKAARCAPSATGSSACAAG